MKLINHTLSFLAGILLISASLLAILLYLQLLKQIRAAVDEGLSYSKIVIIDHIKDDSLIIQRDQFLENNYIIRPLSEKYALNVRDTFKDTLIFSTLQDDYQMARLLTTAFLATNGNYYEMKVISQELDKRSLLKKVLSSLLWFFLLLVLSTMLVNRFALKNTWKPFYKLLHYLNDFQLDKRKILNPVKTNIHEFKLLNSSIQNLLKSNIDIYSKQKEFIENAAHELQTPLAIAINKLELLASDSNVTENTIRRLDEILEALQRLSRLNKSLLLLSKIENRQFIVREKIDFDKTFHRILRDFKDISEFKKVNINYLKQTSWFYNMNPDLAEMLIVNLIKNAIIHNIPDGEVKVILHNSGFRIENTGINTELDQEMIFGRFNKKTSNKNSSGLGLSIVKAIVMVSDLSISYSYNERHIFCVNSLRNK